MNSGLEMLHDFGLAVQSPLWAYHILDQSVSKFQDQVERKADIDDGNMEFTQL
jgi:hypothetical protein